MAIPDSQASDAGILTQKEEIRAYAADNDLTLQRIYDDGERASGFDPEDLKAFQAVKDRICSGGVEVVVTRDKRRLVRDPDQVMRLIPDFRENDVEWHTALDGPLDLSDPLQAAIEILSATLAAEEKQQEIEKAVEATTERASDPEIEHGRVRFGMQYDESGLKQVPGDCFDDVLRIIQMRDEGASYREIASEVGCSPPTVGKVLERRDWYLQRRDD